MFAIFNRPTAFQAQVDDTLDTFVLDAFRCASRSSRIRGSVMHWTSEDFTDELKQIADDRDLSLRLTTGEAGQAGIPQEVRSFFQSIERGIAATVDPDGFLNHSKFFLFNSLKFKNLMELHPDKVFGDAVDVTGPALYLASANINEDGKHNVGVLVPIDNKLRKRLRGYANDLYSEYEESINPLIAFLESVLLGEATQRSRYTALTRTDFKLYLYPRTTGKDTIVGVLKNILHYSTRSKEPCTVRVVTPRFRNSREQVALALKQLHENGARIEVVTRSRSDEDGNGDPELGSKIEPILVECAHLFYQRSKDKVNIHSKYLLVDAPYKSGDGHAQQKLVWVGTPNLTKSAVSSHWEMLMKLQAHTGAHDLFLKDFEYLKAHAATLASTPAGE